MFDLFTVSLHRLRIPKNLWCLPMENGSQYPERGELSESDRLMTELRNLKLMFPEKNFRIAEVDGIKKVEVVLDW